MKYIIIYLLLICSNSILSAQSELDSLWNIWLNESLNDTARLDALDRYISDGEIFTDPVNASYLGQQMLELATIVGNRIYQARSYSIMARSQWNLGNKAEACRIFTQALKISENIGYKQEIAVVLWNLGVIHLQMSQYPSSIDYHTRSLAIYKALKDTGAISGIINNIGEIYETRGDYSKALDYYQESISIYKDAGFLNAVALNNIGKIFIKQGNYTKALDYFNELLEQDSGATKFVFYDSTSYRCEILLNIGDIYANQGNYHMALEFYLQSLELTNSDYRLRDSDLRLTEKKIGVLYEKMKKGNLAVQWCTKSLINYKKGKSISGQRDACECLYKSYKLLGDDKRALEYYELKHYLEDSLNIEETAEKLQKMEFANQMFADSIKQVEESQRVELLHKNEVLRKDKTRNILLSLGSILLLFAIGLVSRNRYVNNAKNNIEKEKKRSDNLLLNILPYEIAEELKLKGEVAAQNFNLASVLFTDFQDFTQTSSKMSASDLVDEINTCFKAFDKIIDRHGIEKIKTIGDGYMAAGGLPIPSNDSVKNTVLAAIEMQDFIKKRKDKRGKKELPTFEMRVGIHSGPVVAGVVGSKKFQYDIWGDTVNIASRMESSGNVGKVNISQTTYELLKDDLNFKFESRGEIEVKGKGEIAMWYVEKA